MLAPHPGAWIETAWLWELATWAGLAPHPGAWIETQARSPLYLLNWLAPHPGAWIETVVQYAHVPSSFSPPTRGRGLKHRGRRVPVLGCPRPPPGGVD